MSTFLALLAIICLIAGIGATGWWLLTKIQQQPKHVRGMRLGSLTAILWILTVLLFIGSGTTNHHTASNAQTAESTTVKRHSKPAASPSSSKPVTQHKTVATTTTTHHQSASQSSTDTQQRHASILAKLVSYTNSESAGPTSNYYWTTGKAHLTGFSNYHAGDYHFTADSQGRTGTARALLTYSEFQSSQGSRQGDPLEPPAWPASNPRVAINYSLTGRTYHGYLYNRSHSISDSLLGSKSYTSEYNFTTGTRPQNVGANQSGGMRYAAETAEDYWDAHPNTTNTIAYETTPLYQGSEQIPRGSIVDIKSSDGAVNTEIVVINDVEGIKISYNTGSSNAKPITSTTTNAQSNRSTASSYSHPATTHSTHSTTSTTQQSAGATTEGRWHVAAAGMVYVSDSNKYYSRVTNPGNYQYESQSQATASGATQASRGNQYARP